MSKFQSRVKSLLGEIFGKIPIKEEVNVQKLFPEYESGKEHYDLVLPYSNLIVECHGEQHRTLTSFGEKDPGKMVSNFVSQKRRDRRKEEIARENGWSYLIIWYDDLQDNDDKARERLKSLISEALSEE